MAAVPSTPRHSQIKTYATPLTPRSAHAQEIKARHQIAHQHTLSISHFTTLLATLTPSSSPPSLFTPTHTTERTRLELIEEFRMSFLMGEFMREKPPELQEDAFSDGTRASLGGASTVASSLGGDGRDTPALPRSLVERGILAERTIKANLKKTGVLLTHSNHKSFPSIARRAMTKTLAFGKPVYVACGLLRSPNFVREYEERGWAAPGVRWGNFKTDLVKFSRKEKGEGEGECVWEVLEIKYSSSDKDIVYANYKVQSVFCAPLFSSPSPALILIPFFADHLALLKILSSVPNLSPSHKVSLWISHDPLSPTYIEKPLALRTHLAFAEHHLFVLLPQWLHFVTKNEWRVYEEKKTALAAVSDLRSDIDTVSFTESSPPPPPKQSTPMGFKTSGLPFLERLQSTVRLSFPPFSQCCTPLIAFLLYQQTTPAPPSTPSRPSSPLKREVTHFSLALLLTAG
ncbi:hypothetical protein P7C70_g1382, partial [Phenoliferia sp. Uapishka_3]